MSNYRITGQLTNEALAKVMSGKRTRTVAIKRDRRMIIGEQPDGRRTVVIFSRLGAVSIHMVNWPNDGDHEEIFMNHEEAHKLAKVIMETLGGRRR